MIGVLPYMFGLLVEKELFHRLRILLISRLYNGTCEAFREAFCHFFEYLEFFFVGVHASRRPFNRLLNLLAPHLTKLHRDVSLFLFSDRHGSAFDMDTCHVSATAAFFDILDTYVTELVADGVVQVVGRMSVVSVCYQVDEVSGRGLLDCSQSVIDDERTVPRMLVGFEIDRPRVLTQLSVVVNVFAFFHTSVHLHVQDKVLERHTVVPEQFRVCNLQLAEELLDYLFLCTV